MALWNVLQVGLSAVALVVASGEYHAQDTTPTPRAHEPGVASHSVYVPVTLRNSTFAELPAMTPGPPAPASPTLEPSPTHTMTRVPSKTPTPTPEPTATPDERDRIGVDWTIPVYVNVPPSPFHTNKRYEEGDFYLDLKTDTLKGVYDKDGNLTAVVQEKDGNIYSIRVGSLPESEREKIPNDGNLPEFEYKDFKPERLVIVEKGDEPLWNFGKNYKGFGGVDSIGGTYITGEENTQRGGMEKTEGIYEGSDTSKIDLDEKMWVGDLTQGGYFKMERSVLNESTGEVGFRIEMEDSSFAHLPDMGYNVVIYPPKNKIDLDIIIKSDLLPDSSTTLIETIPIPLEYRADGKEIISVVIDGEEIKIRVVREDGTVDEISHKHDSRVDVSRLQNIRMTRFSRKMAISQSAEDTP